MDSEHIGGDFDDFLREEGQPYTNSTRSRPFRGGSSATELQIRAERSSR